MTDKTPFDSGSGFSGELPTVNKDGQGSARDDAVAGAYRSKDKNDSGSEAASDAKNDTSKTVPRELGPAEGKGNQQRVSEQNTLGNADTTTPKRSNESSGVQPGDRKPTADSAKVSASETSSRNSSPPEQNRVGDSTGSEGTRASSTVQKSGGQADAGSNVADVPTKSATREPTSQPADQRSSKQESPQSSAERTPGQESAQIATGERSSRQEPVQPAASNENQTQRQMQRPMSHAESARGNEKSDPSVAIPEAKGSSVSGRPPAAPVESSRAPDASRSADPLRSSDTAKPLDAARDGASPAARNEGRPDSSDGGKDNSRLADTRILESAKDKDFGTRQGDPFVKSAEALTERLGQQIDKVPSIDGKGMDGSGGKSSLVQGIDSLLLDGKLVGVGARAQDRGDSKDARGGSGGSGSGRGGSDSGRGGSGSGSGRGGSDSGRGGSGSGSGRGGSDSGGRSGSGRGGGEAGSGDSDIPHRGGGGRGGSDIPNKGGGGRGEGWRVGDPPSDRGARPGAKPPEKGPGRFDVSVSADEVKIRLTEKNREINLTDKNTQRSFNDAYGLFDKSQYKQIVSQFKQVVDLWTDLTSKQFHTLRDTISNTLESPGASAVKELGSWAQSLVRRQPEINIDVRQEMVHSARMKLLDNLKRQDDLDKRYADLKSKSANLMNDLRQIGNDLSNRCEEALKSAHDFISSPLEHPPAATPDIGDIKKLTEEEIDEILNVRLREMMPPDRTPKEEKQAVPVSEDSQESITSQTMQHATHVVKVEETVTSIAVKYCGMAECAVLIAELNRGVISATYEQGDLVFHAPPGAVLRLPYDRDIREFKENVLGISSSPQDQYYSS